MSATQRLEFSPLMTEAVEAGALTPTQAFLLEWEMQANPRNPWPPQMQNWIRRAMLVVEMDGAPPEILLH